MFRAWPSGFASNYFSRSNRVGARSASRVPVGGVCFWPSFRFKFLRGSGPFYEYSTTDKTRLFTLLCKDMDLETGVSQMCNSCLEGLDVCCHSHEAGRLLSSRIPSLDSVGQPTPFPSRVIAGESADSGFQEMDVPLAADATEDRKLKSVANGVGLTYETMNPAIGGTSLVVPDDTGHESDEGGGEISAGAANIEEVDLQMSLSDSGVCPDVRPLEITRVTLGPPSEAVGNPLTDRIVAEEDGDKVLSRSGSNRVSRRSVRRNVQFALEQPSLPDSTNSPSTAETLGAAIFPEAVSSPGPQSVLDSGRGFVDVSSSTRVPQPAPIPPATEELPATPLPERATPTTTPSSERRETEEERRRRVGGFWPHAPSSFFASLTCTVGMFDICRFSYLSFQYGGGFILQFLMLTVVFGLPMLSFQMSVGQFLGAGMMDMWKVSPIFYGVGISAIFAMALYGIYNVIPVSWMFVYFRDSFVTNLTFKWGECRNIYRPEECQKYPSFNSSDILEKAVPAYFQNRVLQRQAYGKSNSSNSTELVFENVFNLAVIWMVVFICLSKGIKSYGKVVLAFGIFPMLSFYLLSIEILRRASSGAEFILNMHTDMSEFFLNGWSWLAAAREVFFIWGMNGAALMQIASHNKLRHNVKRDCAIVILITLSIILLSAFLACACISIIYKYDHYQHRYIPSSFETMESAQFLIQLQQIQRTNLDIKDFTSTNYMLGVESTYYRSDTSLMSGHQAVRFASEIYPTALVTLGPSRISAFWPVLFYLCLITFGIAQQLAVWKCVIEGVLAIHPEKLRSWETSITFLACIFGFVFGLPFTTQVGVFVVHFMDICVGSAWWIMIIYLAQVFALLLIRGRPYTSDDIVVILTNSPMMKKWLAPIISFSWNVVLPVTLLVLAVTSFKLGDFGRLFSWTEGTGYMYWPVWAKQLGALIQVLPIVIIPVVAFIQAIRHLSKGSGSLVERCERLVRPTPVLLPCEHDPLGISTQATNSQQEPETTAPRDDPPPKYTPPPSYNTATGLKVLKRLNSLRRSFRRSQRGIVRTSDIELQQSSERVRSISPRLTTTTAEVVTDVPPSYTTIVETTQLTNIRN